jgi:hypothetical protein
MRKISLLPVVWLVTAFLWHTAGNHLVDAASAVTRSRSLPQDDRLPTAERDSATIAWKCPPQVRQFCTLPARFPQHIVSTGGPSGCVPGARMRRNTQCTVTCKAGTAVVRSAGYHGSTTHAPGAYRCAVNTPSHSLVITTPCRLELHIFMDSCSCVSTQLPIFPTAIKA